MEIGLFNAATDELIANLGIGDTQILASEVEGVDLTIAAVVPNDSPFFGTVESMHLDLNNGAVTKIENIQPYALFGDNPRGDLNPGNFVLEEGQNTIVFDLYSANRLKGDLLGTVSRTFSIV